MIKRLVYIVLWGIVTSIVFLPIYTLLTINHMENISDSQKLWVILGVNTGVSLVLYTISPKTTSPIKWRYVAYSLCGVVAAHVIALIYRYSHTYFYGTPFSANDVSLIAIKNYLGEKTPLVIAFASIIFLFAPIIEELIFRDLFTKWIFGRRYSIMNGLVSSLLFGLIHASGDMITTVCYSLLGAIFYTVYKLSQEHIAMSIMTHSLYNITLTMMILLT